MELAVLNAIIENGFYTYDEISQRASISKRTVIRVIPSLSEKGYIVREGSKKK